MRLLIDANVLLDVLQKREPHYRNSALLWKICETEKAEGFVSALTAANLVYVMRKELSPDKIADIFQKLRLIFRFVDLTMADIMKAADMKWPDFEDAVQHAAAERIRADYIITRNVRDFQLAKIAALTPAEFLTRI